MHISGTPHAVLQIDWPLWPCDCYVVEWLVQNVEGKVSLSSFTPESDLEIDSLCNGRCQQNSKKAKSDGARQALRSNCGPIRLARLRSVACAACTLLWFVATKQPFQRRNCKHQQEDSIAHQPQLVKRPVRNNAWHNENRQPVDHKTPPSTPPPPPPHPPATTPPP